MVSERVTIGDIDLEAVMYFQRMSVSHNRMTEDSVTNDIAVVLDNLNLVDECGKLKKCGYPSVWEESRKICYLV